MYVTLISKRSPYQKSFSVDVNGNVEFIHLMGTNDAHLPLIDVISTRHSNEFIMGDEIGKKSKEQQSGSPGIFK